MSGAILNGVASSHDFPIECFFEWGLTTAYGNSVPAADFGKNSGLVAFNYPLTGLFPSTTYHYRAVLQYYFGTIEGPDQQFTTLPSGGDEPQFTTYGDFPQNCGVDWVLGVNVLPEGLQTTGHLEWGTTTGYGNTTPDVDLGDGTDEVGLGSEGLIGSHALLPGTTYHWRAHLFGPWGSKNSPDQTFTTPASFCADCGCNPVASVTGSAPFVELGNTLVQNIDAQTCEGEFSMSVPSLSVTPDGSQAFDIVLSLGNSCCEKTFQVTWIASASVLPVAGPGTGATVTGTRNGGGVGGVTNEVLTPGGPSVTYHFVVTKDSQGEQLQSTLLPISIIVLNGLTCNGCVNGVPSSIC